MSYNQTCFSDSQCYYLYECQNQECVHNEIWPPDAMQIIVTLILPFLIGIINVGGLGGGVVKVPIMMILLNYQQKIAAQIGYCITFGSGLPNAILLIFQKHPYLDRPLIDFNTVAILNTTVLLGSTIGSLANQLLPDLYLIVMFIIFLLVITPYLWKRAKNLWKEEIKQVDIEQMNQVISQEKLLSMKSLDEKEISKIIMEQEPDILKRQKSIMVQANFLESGQDNAQVNSILRVYSRNASMQRSVSNFLSQSKLKPYLQSQLKTTNNLSYIKKFEPLEKQNFTLVQEGIQDEILSEQISQDGNSQRSSVAGNQQNQNFQNSNMGIQQQQDSDYKEDRVLSSGKVKEYNSSQDLKNKDQNNQLTSYFKLSQDLELNKLIFEESKIIPIKKMTICISQLLIVILLNLLRGEGSQSIIGVEKCGAVFWIITSMIAFVSLIVGIIVVNLLMKEQKYKQNLGYEYDSKDLRYNSRTFLQLFGIGAVGGFLTGSVNAGASMAVLPVLLLLGMHPRVASATSGFNTAFMALTLITTVILSGDLSMLDIAFFTLLAMIGGFIVSKVIYYLVNKYKKQSLVLFSVFFISILINISNIIYIIRTQMDYGWQSLVGLPQFC